MSVRRWRADKEAERIHALSQAGSVTFLIEARAALVRAYEAGFREGHEAGFAARAAHQALEALKEAAKQ